MENFRGKHSMKKDNAEKRSQTCLSFVSGSTDVADCAKVEFNHQTQLKDQS